MCVCVCVWTHVETVVLIEKYKNVSSSLFLVIKQVESHFMSLKIRLCLPDKLCFFVCISVNNSAEICNPYPLK